MEEYIRKGNHNIAVFMEDFYDTGLEPSYYIRKNKEYGIEEAQYHSSWDWIMPAVDKIEELGFRVYLDKYSCQIYRRDATFPENFIVDSDFKEDRLENVFDGVSAFAEWWCRKRRKRPALKKHPELEREISEFISDWMIEKVLFKEENIFETESRPGKTKKWYPVHPKGSSNRPYLEERMRAGLSRLIRLKNLDKDAVSPT
jgi:hypothetical protein